MKVNIWQIIVDHYKTLRDHNSHKISFTDVVLFVGIPIAGGILGYYRFLSTSKDFYNVSITFFGIFVALLLNFQVAAFGIYNRKWSLEEDGKLSIIQARQFGIRKQLLQEINANISYLIIVSIFGIVMFVGLYTIDQEGRIEAAGSVIVYIHFILTLLMIIKRSHTLFKREYDET